MKLSTNALSVGLPCREKSIFPYPTYTSGVQMLATEMAMEDAMTGLSETLIRTASKVWR
ncbi:MAG: hypothetical protein ABI158_10325 [Edaphobacter sp.]